MATAYYGDPEVLKFMLQGVQSIALPSKDGIGFDDQVALADALVTPILESNLDQIFSSWPDPDNGETRTPISVLWCYAMMDEILGIKGQARSQQTNLERKAPTKYEALLERIQKGELPIRGATRRSNFSPSTRLFTSPRVAVRDFEEPKVVGDLFPVGLRGNVPR